MLRSIFAAARGWLLRAPDCKHQEKFGLAKLEGSLVLLLFLVQIGLTFLGVQENFWMALFCWLAIVVLALHILWKWEVAAGLRNLGRVGLSVALVVVVVYFLYPALSAEYKREHRILRVVGRCVKMDTRDVQIGNALLKFFPDAGPTVITFGSLAPLIFEVDSHGCPVISTSVRDGQGNIVAEIAHNAWWVSESHTVSHDYNYSDDALEVEDARGLVVLQVHILSDRVKFTGEWHDDTSNGVRLVEEPDGFIEFRLTLTDHKLDDKIIPWFLYPSRDNLGRYNPNRPRTSPRYLFMPFPMHAALKLHLEPPHSKER
jgi:hypothetical protein